MSFRGPSYPRPIKGNTPQNTSNMTLWKVDPLPSGQEKKSVTEKAKRAHNENIVWKPALRKQPDGKTIPAAPWALSVKYGMGRWSMPSGTWYSLSNQPTNIFQEILICLNKINSKPTFMQLEKISEIESNFEFSSLKRLLFGRDLKNN